MNKNLDKLKPEILKVLKKHGIVRAGIFGSYARGDFREDSDIDILIETSKPLGFAFVGVQFELEEKLGKKVDLLTYKYLSPYLKKRILNEEIRIL